MKQEIKVPAMGESISEATIGTILKPNGSLVNADDEILELETDKVNQALYAPVTGIVQINVSQGDVVKIGQVIGSVEASEGGQQAETPKKQEKPPEQKPEPAKETPKAETPKPQPQKAEPSKPVQSELPKHAKDIIEESRMTRDAFLEELKGSEETGTSTPFYQPTVAIPAPEPSTGEAETRKKMSKIRRLIANRMIEAQHNAAMLTTFNEVDMTEVIKLREKYKEDFQKKYGTKLGFMSFFVKAVVSALKEYPDVNASIEGDEIVYKHYYDIGLAVGTDRGVIVPVVRACDKKSFAEIEGTLEKYAAQAKDGSINVDELQGGTFTITNGGTYGSLVSTPILNPPQSAILGMHKIIKRPVAINDAVVIRPMMYLALTYDHRIIDGKTAVTFLVHIKNILEDPSRLFLQV